MKNVTVSQSCGKWYVSIQTEYDVAEPVHKAASIVGLDAGVTKLATLSEGTVYPPFTSFKVSQPAVRLLRSYSERKLPVAKSI